MVACSSVPNNGSNSDQNNLAATSSDNAQSAPFSDSTAMDKPSEHKGFFSRESAVPDNVTLPAGTVVNVRLQNSVSSATASSGQSFDAVLDEPLVVNGKTVAPRGAAVNGRVVEAKSSGRLHDSGYLRLTLSAITINGKSVPVETSSLFAKGANHNKRNAALIGGGAGAGALIGGLAGGGKGALIGGLVGAGAGTGGAYATGKKDVAFSAERRLTFRLTQPVTTKS
jgi:hypothetical protein